MRYWWIDLVANLVIAVGYFAIAAHIAVPLIQGRQVHRNRLAALIAVIFFTCALHRIGFVLGPITADTDPSGWEWLCLPDVGGATAGIAYWVTRRRRRHRHNELSLFPDYNARKRAAQEINDNIIQGLAIVNYSLEVGDSTRAGLVARDTLVRAQAMMGELLDLPVQEGDLRLQVGIT